MDKEQQTLTPPKHVGLAANPDKTAAGAVAGELITAFLQAGIRVSMDEKTSEIAVSVSDEVETVPGGIAELAPLVDMIVVLGGDGTMLGAVRELGDNGTPVVGINLGRLGFLTSAPSGGAETLVSALVAGEYSLSQRSIVSARVKRAGRAADTVLTGLNEAVISRGSISRIINLETFVDGQFLNRFHADGLIIATPTGSTAYSLSAGGPLVSPAAGVFLVTPICPHALANRSFVLADTSVVEIRREDRADEIILSLDGQTMTPVHAGDVVVVTKAPYTVPLVMLHEHTLYEVLQKKLHWHGSSV